MADGAPLTFNKVDALPDPLEADAIYFVRTVTGMQIVVTTETGDAVSLEVDGSTIFTQEFPVSAQWLVNHNLGHLPASVTLLSPGGVEIEANIVHTSDNQFVVDLSPPTAGQVIVQ